jgi:alkylation response protein AidB-like acyl-CoA dehydrogenase
VSLVPIGAGAGPDEAAALDAFRAEVRAWVLERLAPRAEEWEAQRCFPRATLREMGRRGYLGLTLSRESGGQGRSLWYQVVLAEELMKARMLGFALSLALHAFVCLPCLDDLGRDTPPIAETIGAAIRGERILGLALTEPTGGSSLRTRMTHAEQRADGYALSGEKLFITNGPIADAVIVLAATDPGRLHRGLSLFFVPTDRPGFRVKAEQALLGLHTSPTGWLALEGCTVPASYLLGREHAGFHYAQKYTGYERLLGGIACVAYAQEILELTLDHLRRRRLDGVALARQQVVRHRVAELVTRLEAARQLGYFAVAKLVAGQRAAREIAMVKLLGTELAQETVAQCGQWFGGYAFLEAHPLARAARDVRMATVGGGPSEVMKEIIAAHVSL